MLPPEKLAIPCCEDDRRRIWLPEDITQDFYEKNLKGKIHCPRCGSPVLYVPENINQAHFKHKPSEISKYCRPSSESWEHLVQKYTRYRGMTEANAERTTINGFNVVPEKTVKIPGKYQHRRADNLLIQDGDVFGASEVEVSVKHSHDKNIIQRVYDYGSANIASQWGFQYGLGVTPEVRAIAANPVHGGSYHYLEFENVRAGDNRYSSYFGHLEGSISAGRLLGQIIRVRRPTSYANISGKDAAEDLAVFNCLNLEFLMHNRDLERELLKDISSAARNTHYNQQEIFNKRDEFSPDLTQSVSTVTNGEYTPQPIEKVPLLSLLKFYEPEKLIASKLAIQEYDSGKGVLRDINQRNRYILYLPYSTPRCPNPEIRKAAIKDVDVINPEFSLDMGDFKIPKEEILRFYVERELRNAKKQIYDVETLDCDEYRFTGSDLDKKFEVMMLKQQLSLPVFEPQRKENQTDVFYEDKNYEVISFGDLTCLAHQQLWGRCVVAEKDDSIWKIVALNKQRTKIHVKWIQGATSLGILDLSKNRISTFGIDDIKFGI